MRGWLDDLLLVALIVFGAMTFAGLTLFGITWVSNALSLPQDLAQIEQLRHDAALTDPVRAEDVIGQVTETNQKIRSNQSLNDQWWAGWTIPDEWDSVQIIEVPR